MIKRRGFLKYSSALALGSLLLNRLPAQSDFFSDSKPGSIGVQLFSVPRMLEKDFAGTMKMLAQIGYKEIEFYGPYPFSAAEDIERWKAVTHRLDFRAADILN